MTAHQTVETQPAPTPLVGMLRKAMDARGWSNRRLAEEAGLPPSTVQYILQSKGNTVPAETLEPIAEALGLPWDAVERAEMASRSATWELPPRAQKLSAAGRRALVAYMDWMIEQEQVARQR